MHAFPSKEKKGRNRNEKEEKIVMFVADHVVFLFLCFFRQNSFFYQNLSFTSHDMSRKETKSLLFNSSPVD